MRFLPNTIIAFGVSLIVPLALSPEFAVDRGKQTQWRAFVSKSKLSTGGAGFDEILAALHGFIMPPTGAVAAGKVLDTVWPARGPWRPL